MPILCGQLATVRERADQYRMPFGLRALLVVPPAMVRCRSASERQHFVDGAPEVRQEAGDQGDANWRAPSLLGGHDRGGRRVRRPRCIGRRIVAGSTNAHMLHSA
jgi:hypothetical protein